jgi:dihydrodipicolinate synthase/N-acetylneuraminate lyase
MDRSVHYDALSAESAQALAKQALELGMKALLAVNKSAMQAEKRDLATPPAQQQRMTFGVYFYAEPSATDKSSGAKP